MLLFGSTLRNGPMAIQALSRVLDMGMPGHHDSIDDAAMVELYDRIVTDNGGIYEAICTL